MTISKGLVLLYSHQAFEMRKMYYKDKKMEFLKKLAYFYTFKEGIAIVGLI